MRYFNSIWLTFPGLWTAFRMLLVVALTAFSVTPAFANEIALQFSEIPRGMVVVYESDDGTKFSHHYVGQTSRGYQVDHYIGDMATGPTRTSFHDASGNTLGYTQPDGRSRTYSPHYCNRTPGTCHTELVDQKGNQRSLTVKTRLTADGYKVTQSQKVNGKTRRFKTEITLGTYGIRTFERKNDGRTIRMINSYIR